MDIYSLFALLRSADNDKVALFDISELLYGYYSVFINGNAVHPALLREEPFAVDFKILRKNAHGMVALGNRAVFFGGHKHRVGSVFESFLVEIRRDILS